MRCTGIAAGEEKGGHGDYGDYGDMGGRCDGERVAAPVSVLAAQESRKGGTMYKKGAEGGQDQLLRQDDAKERQDAARSHQTQTTFLNPSDASPASIDP